MKRFDFGDILTRAWQIIWKFKVLWIFGILAGCGRNTPSNNSRASVDDGLQNNNSWPGLDNWANNLNMNELVLIIVGVLLFALLVMVLIVAIKSMGQIGLARGTVRAEEGAHTLSFGELWDTKYFRRVFLLNFIIGLAVFLLVILITVPFIFSVVGIAGTGEQTAGPAILGLLACLLPLVCVLAVVGWLASIWISLSQNAVVVEDLGVRDGFKRGWHIFRENLANTVAMGLILGILGFFANLVIGLPLFVVGLPALLGVAGGAAAGSEGVIIGSVILFMLCCLAYLPVLLLGSGIINSYTGTAWTLTFMRLAGATAAAVTPVFPEAPLPKEPEELIPPAL